MRRVIEKLTNGDNLIDQFGEFWFYTGFLGQRILGGFGFIGDALVVYGIFLYITGNQIIAWSLAGSISLTMQLFMGQAVLLSVWGIYTGKIKQPAYLRMLIITVFFSVTILSGSLYISTHNEFVVKGVKRPPAKENIDKLYNRKEAELATATTAFDNEIKMAEKNKLEEIKAIERERATYVKATKHRIQRVKQNGDSWQWLENRMGTNEKEYNRRIVAVQKKYNDQISLTHAQKNTMRSRIDSIHSTMIATAITKNANSEMDHATDVSYWGAFLMYGNFIINCGRVLLLIAFGVWMYDARRELDTKKERAAKKATPKTPEILLVSDTAPPEMPVRRATQVTRETAPPPTRKSDTKPDESDTKPDPAPKVIIQTKDLSPLKRATRRSYERMKYHAARIEKFENMAGNDEFEENEIRKKLEKAIKHEKKNASKYAAHRQTLHTYGWQCRPTTHPFRIDITPIIDDSGEGKG